MNLSLNVFEGIQLVHPVIYHDQRGCFFEHYHQHHYHQKYQLPAFVQDNVSISSYGVIRGMHFQSFPGQAKLVSVLKGKIFDVVVDMRKESASYKQWRGFDLDDQARAQLYIPVGFAHGFCVLSSEAIVHYKVSQYYDPKTEVGFRYDDPEIAIAWPLAHPILSDRDLNAPLFKELGYA